MPRPSPRDNHSGEAKRSGNKAGAGEASSHEEGIYLNDLPDGAVLDVETEHHHYTIVKKDHTQASISSHPRFCPEPVTVEIDGSTEGRFNLKPGYIGRGLHLVFEHPVYHRVTTSPILDIHKLERA